eukprot:2659942-Prymnesium_polylepis.1
MQLGGDDIGGGGCGRDGRWERMACGAGDGGRVQKLSTMSSSCYGRRSSPAGRSRHHSPRQRRRCSQRHSPAGEMGSDGREVHRGWGSKCAHGRCVLSGRGARVDWPTPRQMPWPLQEMEDWNACHGCEPRANRVQIARKWTCQHESGVRSSDGAAIGSH